MDTIFKIFSNEIFGTVRTIFDQATGEAWFLGTDIAKALGYANPREAVADHTFVSSRKALKYVDCSELLRSKMWVTMDRKDKVFINEPGVYSLIFGSKLPAAEAFQKWVYETILPSIRKNGGYIMGQETLSADAQSDLTKQIQHLSKELDAYKEDGNMWMDMYFNLEKEYLKANASSVPAETIKNDVAEKADYVLTPDGFLISRKDYLSWNE